LLEQRRHILEAGCRNLIAQVDQLSIVVDQAPSGARPGPLLNVRDDALEAFFFLIRDLMELGIARWLLGNDSWF
jgi:hypothetical protein